MGGMSAGTVAALGDALADPTVVDRYWSHVRRVDDAGVCWLWTGAISGNGHGRFQVGDTYLDVPGRPRRRRTFVVIAHRFGFAIAYGLEPLLNTPLVAPMRQPAVPAPRPLAGQQPPRQRPRVRAPAVGRARLLGRHPRCARPGRGDPRRRTGRWQHHGRRPGRPAAGAS